MSETTNDPVRLVKAGWAARYLCISERHLWWLVSEGELSKIKLGKRCTRFDRNDLDGLISRNKNGSGD
jgi:excisionase family DNA binding protein|uniref:Helix-turn-helix domain-containing protein n=1 Tax=uncultured marine virus TaxID=186617 RepID=A0A0F7L3V2_9VIRU|nr:hypothetical protein [uncultured marine virus]